MSPNEVISAQGEMIDPPSLGWAEREAREDVPANLTRLASQGYEQQ